MLEILPGFLQEYCYQERNLTDEHRPGLGEANKNSAGAQVPFPLLCFKIEKNAKRRKIEFKMVINIHHFRH